MRVRFIFSQNSFVYQVFIFYCKQRQTTANNSHGRRVYVKKIALTIALPAPRYASGAHRKWSRVRLCHTPLQSGVPLNWQTNNCIMFLCCFTPPDWNFCTARWRILISNRISFISQAKLSNAVHPVLPTSLPPLALLVANYDVTIFSLFHIIFTLTYFFIFFKAVLALSNKSCTYNL